jgi:hypothetical protein
MVQNQNIAEFGAKLSKRILNGRIKFQSQNNVMLNVRLSRAIQKRI